jgi:hypothetical protein
MRLGFAALRVLSRPAIKAVDHRHSHINFRQLEYTAHAASFSRLRISPRVLMTTCSWGTLLPAAAMPFSTI